MMLYAFSHSSVSYALFRYALYTVVTHVSYANSVTRFIPLALRSYAVTQLRILYPTSRCLYRIHSQPLTKWRKKFTVYVDDRTKKMNL